MITPDVRPVIQANVAENSTIIELIDNIDSRELKRFRNAFTSLKPVFVLSCWGQQTTRDNAEIREYFEMLEDFIEAGASVEFSLATVADDDTYSSYER